MIRAGDILENPVTGETLVFHETSDETNGEAVALEAILRPGAFVPAAHVHPFQSERFEVLEGAVGFEVDGERMIGRPGDVLVVEPGTAHRFWNECDGEARFLCRVEPALQFESLVETIFALAVEGKTNRKGMPNPLRLAVIAQAHFDTVRLPFPPAWVQRAGIAVGASLGRVAGYRPRYTQAPALRPAYA